MLRTLLFPNRNLDKILFCCLLISGYTGQAQTTKTLQAVTVTAQKPLLERKADKIILHVDALLTATGSNALEVLEQAPGVQTGNEQITLKGKPHVTIFINGQPLYLSGSELTDYLRAISGASLDKIEIMSNPPASFDAAGNGGIINIILKKENKKGFNGTLLSENIQGRYSRITQNGSFNYRNQLFNAYGNIDNYNGNGYSHIDRLKNYPDGSSLLHTTQAGLLRSTLRRFLGKAGIAWEASPKTTFGADIQYIYRDLATSSNSQGLEQYATPATDSLLQTDNRQQHYYNNTNVHTQFRHVYDSSGRELTADADYIQYARALHLQNTHRTGKSESSVTGSLPSTVTIYAIKADYTHPLDKDRKIMAGYKSGIVHTNAAADDSPFTYRENIQAIYGSYAQNAGPFSYQLGLRAEHTRISGSQPGKAYTNLFPGVFFSYKQHTQQWNLSYSQRIDRPAYNQLNPAMLLVDRYTYETGNPLLQPQLSDNLELSYAFRNMFSVSGCYNRIRNGIEQTVTVKDQVFYQRYDNVGLKQLTGVILEGTFAPTRWWTLLPNLQYTHLTAHTILFEAPVSVYGHHWDFSLQQQFSFPKGWSAEIFYSYADAEVFTQYIQAGNWFIHTGAGKKIGKDQGTIKLNIRDVFHTRLDRQQFKNLNGVTGANSRTWDTQSVTLAFSWRFSKGRKATKSNRGGSNEESRRLGEQ